MGKEGVYRRGEQAKAMAMIAKANTKTGHQFEIGNGPWVCKNCGEEDWNMTAPPTGKGNCPNKPNKSSEVSP